MCATINYMVKKAFKLEHMFGSKTRARLMGLFLQHPDDAFYVRELTRKIDAQLNSVRRELKNLIEMGLISEKRADSPVKSKALSEKKKYYIVNTDFILYEDLRALFQKVQILLKHNLVQEIDNKGKIFYFAFTGRFVDATDISGPQFVYTPQSISLAISESTTLITPNVIILFSLHKSIHFIRSRVSPLCEITNKTVSAPIIGFTCSNSEPKVV